MGSKQGVSSLKVLATHAWLDARRCAANLLGEFSEDTTEIALLLIEDEDLTCSRKAAEALLRGSEAERFALQFKDNPDSTIRRLAVLSKGATLQHRKDALGDLNNSVCEAALQTIVEQGEYLSEAAMSDVLKRGLKVSSMISSAVHNGSKVLVEIAEKVQGRQLNELVKELRIQCPDLESKAIQTLISNKQFSVLGRWMQGKKGEQIDAMRWDIIRSDKVEVIERSRLLERLIGRCGEREIAEQNRLFLEQCTNDLLRVTAENLSTASAELGL